MVYRVNHQELEPGYNPNISWDKHQGDSQEIPLWRLKDRGTACQSSQELQIPLQWLILEGIHALLNLRQSLISLTTVLIKKDIFVSYIKNWIFEMFNSTKRISWSLTSLLVLMLSLLRMYAI